VSLESYLEFLGIPGVRLLGEIAANPEARARGLMGRQALEANHGMLFLFPEDVRKSFWGRGVLIPLSIGFIQSEGTLIEILEIAPGDLQPRMPSATYRYALEVNRGWFADNGVEAGERLRFELGADPIQVR
jgi:uncharacterized protein